MRLLLTLVALTVCPALLGQTTHNVPANFTTIQAAIDAAVDGDTVLVAPGTYVENIDFLGKAIIVVSSAGADVTTIDGSGCSTGIANCSVVTCSNGEGAGTALAGFNVQGGNGTGGPGPIGCSAGNCDFLGGGMRIANGSPQVIDCVFVGNSATKGGGLYCINSSPTLTGCSFIGNQAIDFSAGGFAAEGGGVYNLSSQPTLLNCIFDSNLAYIGGGIANRDGSDCKISGCTFFGNTVGATGIGAGVFNDSSSPTVMDSTFLENTAGYGGGIYNESSSSTVTGCNFEGNTAKRGGGMYDAESGSVVTGCTFTANSASVLIPGTGAGLGGGISCGGGDTTVIDCIFSGNLASHYGRRLGAHGRCPNGDQQYVRWEPGGNLRRWHGKSPTLLLWKHIHRHELYFLGQHRHGLPGDIQRSPLPFAGSDYRDLQLRIGQPCR